MEEKKPGVGLSAIILKYETKEVLMGKRKNSHGAGTWSFPGGHLEFFEKLEDCAYREIREETGLEKEDVELMSEYPLTVTNDLFKKENKHYVTLFMKFLYSSGEPKIMEPDKCEQWKWFKWNEIPEQLFLPVKNLIERGYNPFAKGIQNY